MLGFFHEFIFNLSLLSYLLIKLNLMIVTVSQILYTFYEVVIQFLSLRYPVIEHLIAVIFNYVE